MLFKLFLSLNIIDKDVIYVKLLFFCSVLSFLMKNTVAEENKKVIIIFIYIYMYEILCFFWRSRSKKAFIY